MANQAIQASASNAADNSITARIAIIRQMQTDLRTRPVTGSLRALKRIVYKAVRSAFARQLNLNSATVDLVEALYRELEGRAFQSPAPGAAPFVPIAANHAQESNSIVPFATGDVLASCGQTQDQAKINNIRSLVGFNSVYTAPAEMRMPERVTLYSLIFGMQPRNCLEIGTFRGGSSAIICGAMNDTGFGQLACVDPTPKIEPELWSQLSNRCRMFEGPSPDILSEVARQIDELFDFVLIDANHTYEAVRRDVAAVLPYLADQAYLLFHDANYPDVRRAIDESVASCGYLTDCGLMSVEPTVLYENGQSTTWAGLRLLRYQRPVRKARAA
jgi:predicted O-methyltransferase YrrM